jgi:hypothetical protein
VRPSDPGQDDRLTERGEPVKSNETLRFGNQPRSCMVSAPTGVGAPKRPAEQGFCGVSKLAMRLRRIALKVQRDGRAFPVGGHGRRRGACVPCGQRAACHIATRLGGAGALACAFGDARAPLGPRPRPRRARPRGDARRRRRGALGSGRVRGQAPLFGESPWTRPPTGRSSRSPPSPSSSRAC